MTRMKSHSFQLTIQAATTTNPLKVVRGGTCSKGNVERLMSDHAKPFADWCVTILMR